MVYKNRFTIPITDITQGAVSLDQLNSDSVDSTKIVPGGVATVDIADKAITTEKLADDVSIPLAPGAVGTTELATNAVDQSKLQAASVGASEIQDGSVGSDELSPDSVGASELQDNAVDTLAIQNNAVTIDKILNSNVNDTKLSSNSVSTVKIQDLAVTKAKAELGFGRVVLLATPVKVADVSGIIDLDQDVDLSAQIPASAIGCIIGLTMVNLVAITATSNGWILTSAGAGLESLFHGMVSGDLSGAFKFNSTVSLFENEANRTVKLQSTQNGMNQRFKVHVYGYII